MSDKLLTSSGIPSSLQKYNITDSSSSSNPIISVGDGVEREMLCRAFAEYQLVPNRFLTARLDGTYGLTTTPVAPLAASSSRQRDFAIFGALVGLLIINGIAPTPLDPVLLHYFIHDCDFNSITPGLLSEWHHQFYSMIQRWRDTGSDGDISPFSFWLAAYADNTEVSYIPGLDLSSAELELHKCCQISAIQNRDDELHVACGAFMVYRAVVGSEAPAHSDI